MHIKNLFLSIALLVTATCFSQQITVNEKQTKIYFTFLDQNVTGELSEFKFTGAIDLNAFESSSISGSVATESLDTNNWLRSRHLRSKKYFYAKAHPRLFFKSDHIDQTANGFRVSGSLTIKGITKEVIWDFSIRENTLIGITALNTHDYSIKVYDEKKRNEVTIKIVLPYTKKD